MVVKDRLKVLHAQSKHADGKCTENIEKSTNSNMNHRIFSFQRLQIDNIRKVEHFVLLMNDSMIHYRGVLSFIGF